MVLIMLFNIIYFLRLFSKYIYLIIWKNKNLFVYCCDSVSLINLIRILKFGFNFVFLLDGWVVDFIENKLRFCLTWMIHNFHFRLFLRCFVSEFEAVKSLSKEFLSVPWLEREMFDLFGVFFFGNDDLRRILTDYGFMGFPLRKDFPLSGFFEIRYEDSLRRIVVEPVKLSQEFRLYNFTNPWKFL